MLPLEPMDPTQISAYKLSGVLGRGGQGSVYAGEDGAGAKAAVKVLHTGLDGDDAHRRFVREAEAARKVAPFCTARVLDVGVEQGRPYIVSEYIPGPSLDRLVKNEGARPGTALERLAVATLTALAAIHRAGIVHRDFKPSNVIMGPEGPVVIDFGIARALDQTATSSVMGTPAFMAPEQFEGTAAGPAADLFSWASTMVFAATGTQAFRGDTMPSLMHAILTTEPDLSGVPEAIRPLLARCLDKDPARRPSAEGLLAQLTGLHAAGGTLHLPSPERAVPHDVAAATVPQGQFAGPVPQGPPPWQGPPLMRHPMPHAAPKAPGGVGHTIASVLTLVLGGVLALVLFVSAVSGGGGLHLTPGGLMIMFGALILFAPAFATAAWRHNVGAAICVLLVFPLCLLILVWGIVLGAEDDFPELLLAIVPALLIGLMLAVSALLLWQLNRVAAVLGGIGGLLMAAEVMGYILVATDIELPDLFYDLLGIESLFTRIMLASWLLTVGIALVVRAVRPASPGR
ncbi:serine/threonine-protein kinase [Nonomuraea typhae]|uniref:Serine/threonine-protein kinase n=1 Tax=Nonomuraea typhae TaxID=2603600 RepID=A0ABW7Z9M1_9ACTN